jgi:hypothetical protein
LGSFHELCRPSAALNAGLLRENEKPL